MKKMKLNRVDGKYAKKLQRYIKESAKKKSYHKTIKILGGVNIHRAE